MSVDERLPRDPRTEPDGFHALERVRNGLGPERWDELRALARDLLSSGRLSPRLLFTVTTGRSGTRALAHLSSGFQGVTATHEPKPSFADALRSANRFPGAAAEFWVRRKLPAILPARTACYVETSHLAGLGFLEELALLGVPFELVLLSRPARSVALSLWRLDTIPGRTLRGLRYYASPLDPCRLSLSEDVITALHDYQLCYWYALEVAERAAAWERRSEAGGPPVHRIDASELDAPGAARLLGDRLGFGDRRFGADLFSESRRRGHRNDKRTKKLDRDLDAAALERLESEVHALVDPLTPASSS